MKKRFAEEKIIGILKEAEAGMKVVESRQPQSEKSIVRVSRVKSNASKVSKAAMAR